MLIDSRKFYNRELIDSKDLNYIIEIFSLWIASFSNDRCDEKRARARAHVYERVSDDKDCDRV